MRYPYVRVQAEIPYEEYKMLVELKGNKTWRQIMLEWAKMQEAKR